LLGVGHSAHDTIRALIAAGVMVVAKPFQIGIRIEHPQALVDRWQYGAACGHRRLPPAEYHLVAKRAAEGLGDVYSFCMCPGGMILPTNESDRAHRHERQNVVSRSFANSAGLRFRRRRSTMIRWSASISFSDGSAPRLI
jgi:uncharacterized FAD-dependent dehydrogenase